MSLKALSEYVVFSKYAKYLPEKKRRETWKEQVDRVFDMHERRYSMEIKIDPELKNMFDEARQSVYNKEVLGSQRALQFGGSSIEKHNEKMYNCATTYIDRVEAFSQTMYCLLAGNGVGFSVQKHHVAKLPDLKMPGTVFGGASTTTFVIPDSIEGWADSIKALMESYFVGYDCREVVFDYSKIRPEGSPISGGFKAPGPAALESAHKKIVMILNGALQRQENPSTNKSPAVKLKPIEAYDILMHASDSVLSGGVRRCLPECYEVKLSDGSYKKIGDLKVGDLIAYCGKKYPVTNVFHNGVQELVKINTVDGSHVSTPQHRWLVYNKVNKEIDWVSASEIERCPDIYAFVKDAQ